MSYNARILADSLSPEGIRLTTFEVTFPRFILAEVNTHRVLSRNSASSRAIPVYKQVQKLLLDRFEPIVWATEQKGMSGGEPLNEEDAQEASMIWHHARAEAILAAQKLVKLGVHKSIVNRLLEPFMWHTAIISGTEWSNFFALRTAENAQPEFRKIATMMEDLYYGIEGPRLFNYGMWHLPLVSYDEARSEDWDYWKKVSVGRCARVSYLTHDGVRDPEADIVLHDQLRANGHLSPFEHVATPVSLEDVTIPIPLNGLGLSNFKGWHQYRKDIPFESNYSKVVQYA